MKSVRTERIVRQVEQTYAGTKKPRWKLGDYVKVYSGPQQDHCFRVKEIRFNEDIEQFEYYYQTYGWYNERSLTNASANTSHYDSQGYCDNPGRGF